MQTLSKCQNKTNQGKLISTEPYYTEITAALKKIKQLKQQLRMAKEK